MDLYNGKWWWAYLADDGKITILPYTGDGIIQRTEQLPFCKGIFDVFYATSRHEAQLKIADWLDEQAYYEKKTTQ